MGSFVSQTNYAIYTSYYWDYGLRGAPVCGPPGTPLSIYAEHAPVCYKVVSWAAQAQDGADPQAPDWNTGVSSSQPGNEVLVHKAISAPFLYDLGDGTTMQTIGGVYVYLCLVPPSDTDQLTMSQPPWDSTLMNIIAPGTFVKNLLGPSQPINPPGGYAGMPGQNVPPLFTKPPQPQNVDMMQFFDKPIPP